MEAVLLKVKTVLNSCSGEITLRARCVTLPDNPHHLISSCQWRSVVKEASRGWTGALGRLSGASANARVRFTIFWWALSEEEAINFVSLSFYQWQQTNPSIQRAGRTLSQSQWASTHRLRLSLNVNSSPSVYPGSSLCLSPCPFNKLHPKQSWKDFGTSDYSAGLPKQRPRLLLPDPRGDAGSGVRESRSGASAEVPGLG